MSGFIQIDVSQPGHFTQQDWEKTIIESLYADTDDLGLILNTKVEQRTPILTGALELGERFTANHDPSDKTLVELAPSDQTQIDEWGRVYAPYVEGVLSSPTIHDPAQMYALAETEDLEDIELWALTAIDKGGEKLAQGLGVPYP